MARIPTDDVGSPGSADAPGPTPRERSFRRAHHRAAQHDSAHASHETSLPIPEHPLICREPTQMVTRTPELLALLDQLRGDGSFAYDSEFIGEMSYLPKICLIQVASTRRIALIDPLAAGIDLTEFWKLLGDPGVEKIVHAGQQDVEPVIRFSGAPPANLFDTQLAAGFCGMTHPTALSRLVQELVGAKIGKGLTFTHWDQRPLSPQQIRYAADDVRYLPALRAALGKLLAEYGHTGRATEEFDALCEASQYRFDPNTYYQRVRGSGNLTGSALAILRELTIWRDTTARADDVPPRTLLRDEILVDLARTPVKTPEKFARVRGLPRPIESAHGQAIIDATVRGLATPQDAFPDQRHVEPSPRERFVADAVWGVVQILCMGRGIDPNLVTNRQEVGELTRPILAKETAPDSPLLKGWRRELVAEPLMRFLNDGKSKLVMAFESGKLQTRLDA